jgi:hypothetical protein
MRTFTATVHHLVPRMHRRLSALAAGLTTLFVLALPGSASAVSTRDLVELAKAGLSDDVLVALIEADGTEFHLDAPKILELRAAGLSERVIMAMIKNTRPAPLPDDSTAQAAPPAPAGAPQNDPYFVIIGDKPPEPPPPQETYVMPWVPWVAPVRTPRHPQPFLPNYRGFGRFINDGWIDNTSPGRFMNNGLVIRTPRVSTTR